MARNEVVTCDVCEVQKGKNNHWFRGYRYSRVVPSVFGAAVVGFDQPGPEKLQGWIFSGDFCGEAHALKWLSEQLQESRPTNG